MPNNKIDVRAPNIEKTILSQLAEQIALDIKVSIAASLPAVYKRESDIAIDDVALPIIAYMKKRKLGGSRNRFVGSRKKLITQDIVQHSNRYLLRRKTDRTKILKSRSAANRKSDFRWVKREVCGEALRKFHRSLPFPNTGTIADIIRDQQPQAPISYKGISWRLIDVHCFDETGKEALGGEIGHDEIRMAATPFSHKLETSVVKPFKVKSFEHDGDFKRYDPPKVIHKFELYPEEEYPQTNMIFVNLAETDQGGFGDFLSDFYGAVDTYVRGVLVELGATLGSVGGPAGTVAGAVVGFVVSLIIGWIIEGLRDDIFPTQVSSAEVNSPQCDFNGNLNSPIFHMVFEGHDGKYLVFYDWLLSDD